MIAKQSVKYFYAISFFAYSVVCCTNSYAATAYQVPYFQSYSVEDGLSQITVYEFTEDKFGFIWMATQNGIDRFDGYEFKHYGRAQEDDSTGLRGSVVHSIAADPISGDIWAASINGLSRLHLEEDRFQHYEMSTQSHQEHVMRRLYFDSSGRLWVATDSGVFRYNREPDEFVAVAGITELLPPIYSLVMDASGVLWLGTGKGLMAIIPGIGVVDYRQFTDVEINALTLDGANQLWVGTSGQGVFKLNIDDYRSPQVIWQMSYEDGLADAIVKAIRPMQDGSMWVATVNGLVIFPDANSKSFVVINDNTHPNSKLADNTLSSLYQSTSGVVWVGSWTNGFSIFDPESIKFSKLVLGGFPDTSNVEVDEHQNVWVVNEGGLWQLDPELNTLGHYTFSPDSWESQTLHKISGIEYSSRSGQLWLATRLGLGLFTPGERYVENAGLKGVPIYTVKEDSKGDIWIGTFNDGLYRFDPLSETITGHWRLPLVPRIEVSDPDTIWAASIKGLYRIDLKTGALQHFVHDPNDESSLSHNVVTWISRAKDNQYWVATQAGGLNLMTVSGTQEDEVTFEVFAEHTRLNTISMGAISQEEDGTLWITTIDGITRYHPGFDTIQHFDGRNGSNSSGYYIGSYAKAADGRLFFSGAEGLTYFYPEDIAISEYQPKVFITDINILNKPLLTRHKIEEQANTLNPLFLNELQLTKRDLILSVDFTTLDYSAPKHNQYAYRLEGFDSRWQLTDSTVRTATFTNLDPGDYKLQVKGSNKDGVWSPHVAQLNIRVYPPWWLTTWALFIWISTLGGGLLVLYRWRTSQMADNAKQLKKLVKERTEELEKAIKQLTLISGLDPLTGISNRRDFSAKAEQEFQRFVREEEYFTILMLDIDYFKQCNDTYGHAAGDYVLQTVADILSKTVRAQDIMARWGGEEFIILLPKTDVAQAETVAHKIQYNLAQTDINYERHSLTITLTVGIAKVRKEESLEDVIRRADNALYHGKEHGRNRVEVDA